MKTLTIVIVFAIAGCSAPPAQHVDAPPSTDQIAGVVELRTCLGVPSVLRVATSKVRPLLPEGYGPVETAPGSSEVAANHIRCEETNSRSGPSQLFLIFALVSVNETLRGGTNFHGYNLGTYVDGADLFRQLNATGVLVTNASISKQASASGSMIIVNAGGKQMVRVEAVHGNAAATGSLGVRARIHDARDGAPRWLGLDYVSTAERAPAPISVTGEDAAIKTMADPDGTLRGYTLPFTAPTLTLTPGHM